VASPLRPSSDFAQQRRNDEREIRADPPPPPSSSSPWFLLKLVSFCLGLASAGLLAGALYDVLARRRHGARLLACRGDMQRVQEVLLAGDGDVPMCPCCLEYVRSSCFKSKVVFICGHSFHVGCANTCFLLQDRAGGSSRGGASCPLCAPSEKTKERCCAVEEAEEREPKKEEKGEVPELVVLAPEEEVPELVAAPEETTTRASGGCGGGDGTDLGGTGEPGWGGGGGGGGGAGPSAAPEEAGEPAPLDGSGGAASQAASLEEVRSFMLQSLHRKYPDLVSAACAERWACGHMESWLSELAYPEYGLIPGRQR